VNLLVKRKKVILFVFITIILILVIGMCLAVFRIPIRTIEFTESSKALNNPSRGFYIQIGSGEKERLKGASESGVRLILLAYDLHNYLNKPIDEEKLLELKEALEEAKDNNIKVIFRAAYCFEEDYEDPASLDLIDIHIKQIAEILNLYSENLLCVQAGFLGPWGEWHGSRFLDVSETQKVQVRNRVLESLLGNLNSDSIINVRRPKFIRAAKEAGLDVSRVGLHNDALLSSDDDLGTYDENGYRREDELEWVNNYIQTEINGGEMPMISDYSNIANGVKEFNMLHITYLNLMYNQEVLKQWKTQSFQGQNGFVYMNNHLGYRYYLQNVKLPKYLKSGSTIHMNGVIANSGFALIDDNYQFYIVIQKDNEIFYKKLKIESQNKEKIMFKVDFRLPKELRLSEENSILNMGIVLSDNLSQISSQSCIEFANKETEYKDGINLFARYKYHNNKYQLKQ